MTPYLTENVKPTLCFQVNPTCSERLLSMRHIVLLACLALGLAAPAHAQSHAERLEGLTALIAGNNCGVLRAESDALFGAAGYGDPSEVQMIMFELVLSGRALVDDEGMRIDLLDPGCPLEGVVAPVAAAQVDAYVAALEGNDCELGIADARRIMSAVGIDNPNVAGQIAAALIAEGRLVTLSDPFRVRLVSEICPAS